PATVASAATPETSPLAPHRTKETPAPSHALQSKPFPPRVSSLRFCLSRAIRVRASRHEPAKQGINWAFRWKDFQQAGLPKTPDRCVFVRIHLKNGEQLR